MARASEPPELRRLRRMAGEEQCRQKAAASNIGEQTRLRTLCDVRTLAASFWHASRPWHAFTRAARWWGVMLALA